jgi:DNA-binding CsgD family transcriptional regulator
LAIVKVPKFTPSEERVVRLITLGLSTKEVARVLGKAVSTVDNQRTSAMRAAEINTATLLVRVALLAGITTLDDTLTASERRRLKADVPRRGAPSAKRSRRKTKPPARPAPARPAKTATRKKPAEEPGAKDSPKARRKRSPQPARH